MYKRQAQEGRKWSNGMLSIYLDPVRLDPAGFFPEDVMRYIAYVKSARPAIPGGEVLVPGEPEELMRVQRLKDGVPLPQDTWNAIVEAARRIGIDEARIKRAMQ